MKPVFALLLATTMFAAGCARMTTKVVEKPRVDQELGSQQGNRGYLMGKAPAAGPRKTTRKMLETDIELPTKDELNPWRKPTSQAQPAAGQAQVAQTAPAIQPVRPLMPPPVWEDSVETREQWEPEPAPARTKDYGGTTYTVQKGDTLQKIASKFYGSTKPWRKIYEANQASLKSPDSIYPGQELVIPPSERETEEPGSQYK